ncbi:MAG TPA: hypothetical protein DHU26_00525, partial [Spirochaetaceae bacterium]|nr:hypothetical protein [Spirochaetaceae bacterium]
MQKISRFTLSLLAVAFIAFVLPLAAIAGDNALTITGTVVEVQKYGNLTVDIKPKALYDAGFALGDVLNVTIGGN